MISNRKKGESMKFKGLFLSIIASVSLYAGPHQDAIKTYLEQSISKESVKSGKKATISGFSFSQGKQVDKEWAGYFVRAKINVLENGGNQVIPFSSVFFTNGYFVTNELSTPKADDIKEDLYPKITPSMYDDERLIAGNKNAKHKLVLFSDPICPACRQAVPRILQKVRNNPSEYALYYYHFPLQQIHPTAYAVSQGMIALHRMGKKDVLDRVYGDGVETMKELEIMYGGIKITKKDKEHLEEDLNVTEYLAVRGTPTLYFDGEMDLGGKKFFSKK